MSMYALNDQTPFKHTKQLRSDMQKALSFQTNTSPMIRANMRKQTEINSEAETTEVSQ